MDTSINSEDNKHDEEKRIYRKRKCTENLPSFVESGTDEDEEQTSKIKRTIKIFHASKKSDSDDSSSSSDSSSSDESDSDADNSKPQGEEVNSFEQLNRIRLSRSKLASLCHAHFFDKTVIGCFVRISIGQTHETLVYRAAQVVGVVVSQKTYNLDNTRTNKALRLKHGAEEKVFRMAFTSDKEITENEYVKWRDCMLKANLPLPTTDHIEKKHNDIFAALNYHYTDEDVQKMVAQRSKFIDAPTNYAARKAELLKLKIGADQSGDTQKSREHQREIDKINDIINKRELERCNGSFVISIINQRNREQNAALTGNTLRDADKDDDQFIRKSCKTRMVTGRVNKKADESNGLKIQDKEKASPLKSSPAGLDHSSTSSPLLKFDPALIMGEVPESNPDVNPNLPSVSTQPSPVLKSALKPKKGISFDEFRRRKAEAAASASAGK